MGLRSWLERGVSQLIQLPGDLHLGEMLDFARPDVIRTARSAGQDWSSIVTIFLEVCMCENAVFTDSNLQDHGLILQ